MITVDAPPAPDLPLPLSQSPAYAATLRALGQPVWQASAGGAHALVARSFGLLTTIRGPLWSDEDPGRRAGTLRALGLRLVEAEAETDRPGLMHAGFGRVITTTHVAEWHLGHDGADRRARLHGKWRNALVRAEAAGPTIRENPFVAAPGHWLYAGVRELVRTRRFRPLPLVFTDAFVAANPRAACLWSAWDGNRPIAGMVILRHGPVATYHLGWTSDQGRTVCAHHLLLWQAACWLADRGTIRLDLGTIDTEAAAGLARFKLGTGAVARPLGGSWLRLPGLSCVLASRGG